MVNDIFFFVHSIHKTYCNDETTPITFIHDDSSCPKQIKATFAARHNIFLVAAQIVKHPIHIANAAVAHFVDEKKWLATKISSKISSDFINLVVNLQIGMIEFELHRILNTQLDWIRSEHFADWTLCRLFADWKLLRKVSNGCPNPKCSLAFYNSIFHIIGIISKSKQNTNVFVVITNVFIFLSLIEMYFWWSQKYLFSCHWFWTEWVVIDNNASNNDYDYS